MLTADELRAFEQDIVADFNAGKIRAPVHMAGGNEDALIEIFKDIAPNDWVLGSWRSHYHCLLKGVPRETVRDAILRGRSIALTFPAHRVLCTAIVGGVAPIAVGLAWAIKRRGSTARVHVFMGDMTANCGIVAEAQLYAHGFGLPINWIIEDNKLSVGTVTLDAWGNDQMAASPDGPEHLAYEYTLPHAHVGTGKWVPF